MATSLVAKFEAHEQNDPNAKGEELPLFTTVQMTFLPVFEIRTLAMAVMGLAGGLLPLFSMASDARKDVADMDLAELANGHVSPFEVSAYLDSGYRASNSVPGSRLDTPIRELPFAIQAFTESFIKDQKPRDIFDIARYSPSVTYRSNDFNEGNANLAIRGFADITGPASPTLFYRLAASYDQDRHYRDPYGHAG